MSTQTGNAPINVNQSVKNENDETFLILGCAFADFLFLICVCCIMKMHREIVLRIVTVSISTHSQV